MKTRYLPVIFILILLLSIGFFPVKAAGRRRVVILEVPRLNLSSLTSARTRQYSHWKKLLNQSSVGLVPATGVNTPDPLVIDLYFNSGVMVKLPKDGFQMYDSHELIDNLKAGSLYQSFTGIKVSRREAVNLNINEIKALNNSWEKSRIGFMGRILHRLSFKTAAIGNADSTEPSRFGAALIMDQNGRIDYGAVGPETLRKDAKVPFGFRTDSDRVLHYFTLFWKKADLIVVMLGDLERIESFRNNLSEERKNEFQRLALRRYDKLLARLTDKIDFDSTLFIVYTCLPSPNPQNQMTTLTPLIIRGPGFQSGVLASATTRKPGVVTYSDLRDTIIQFLKEKHPDRFQYTLKSNPGTWKSIVHKQAETVQNYFFRWPILTAYGVMLIGLVIIFGLGLLFGFPASVINFLKRLYLFLLTIPAVFLVESLFNPLHWALILTLTLGLAGLIFSLAYFGSGKNLIKTFIWISAITMGLILLDCLFNGYGQANSFLGYSLVSGARFYGIGNEYLGVFIGSLIVCVSLNMNRLRHLNEKFFWGGVTLLSLILFCPFFGAKVGGGLTALIGLGLTVSLWLRQPIHFRKILKLIGIAFIAFVLTGIWDLYINRNSMSHLGQLFMGVKDGGVGVFSNMVIRKLELNWSLIQYTPLTYVLIAILGAVPFLFKYPPVFLQKKILQYPDIASGFTGLCLTALIALVLNDTGIAATATMFMYGFGMILMKWGNANPVIDGAMEEHLEDEA